MARCPKCNYELVLLEKQRRYKCAKCGSLFLKKEINEIEFQKFNKRERKRDVEKLEEAKRKNRKKPGKKSTMTPEEKKAAQRKWVREYYQRNKEKISARRKESWAKKKAEKNLQRKEKRHANIDDTRQQGRIQHWRNRQKSLAEQNLEFVEDSLSKA